MKIAEKRNVIFVIAAAMLCLFVSGGVVQATESISVTPAETTVTDFVPTLAPEQPVVYVVKVGQAQTYAKINGKYVTLAETFSKDTEVTVTGTEGEYAQFEDGFIHLKDIAVKPDPASASVTPISLVVEPLDEKKNNGASIFMLIFIFLLFVFLSGTGGYMIRGKLDRKKWENDPFRFDPGMRPEPETEPVYADEKPPYPAFEYLESEPETVVPVTPGKKQKNLGLFAKERRNQK